MNCSNFQGTTSCYLSKIPLTNKDFTKRAKNWIFFLLFIVHVSKAWTIGDLFFAIGSRSAIAIWPKDRGAIGDRKINDRDRKNAIFSAIVAFCSRYEVNLAQAFVWYQLNIRYIALLKKIPTFENVRKKPNYIWLEKLHMWPIYFVMYN